MKLNDINCFLNSDEDFSAKLKLIHAQINRQYPLISSIDVVLHNSDTDLLKPYSASYSVNARTHGKLYSKLSATKILGNVAKTNKVRVTNDAVADAMDDSTLSGYLNSLGVKSSLIIPFRIGRKFGGFTFFNAEEKQCFLPSVVEQLNVYAQLVNQLVIGEQRSIATLRSSLLTFLKINNVNKTESFGHLKRVAHYSGMIAECAANKLSLSDEWIEHLVMFAPLHDIGKIFVPEHILTKPGKLSAEEFDRIKQHTVKGREMIESMMDSFGYSNDSHYMDMLRNIVTYHHEAINGSGYPEGLKGEEIPVEARIVAVADVLDALMTERAYKKAWPLEKALSVLQEMVDQGKLDRLFVEHLINNQEYILDIRQELAA